MLVGYPPLQEVEKEAKEQVQGATNLARVCDCGWFGSDGEIEGRRKIPYC